MKSPFPVVITPYSLSTYSSPTMIKGRGSDESAAFFIFSLNRMRFMSSVVYWSINAMASSKRPVSRKKNNADGQYEEIAR